MSIEINIPCFTPVDRNIEAVYFPLIKNRIESFLYILLIMERVLPPNPRLFNFSNKIGLQTESYA